MNGFSDEDLSMIHQQLHNAEASGGSLSLGEMAIAVGYTELKALLARLEAGERLIKALKNKENVTTEQREWERSCGL